jgi:hypothetical protein
VVLQCEDDLVCLLSVPPRLTGVGFGLTTDRKGYGHPIIFVYLIYPVF